MNRIYRLVFNRALGQVQAVSEVASRRHGGSGTAAGGPAVPARAALWLSLLLALAPAWAQDHTLPTGGTIVGGSAEIGDAHNGVLEITQNGRTIIDWSSFNIGADARVRFNQADGSIALNQVLGPDAGISTILGQLEADAGVYLINPNGVVFGEGASVDVGRLMVSTLVPDAQSQSSFLDGGHQLVLSVRSGADGQIVNGGHLASDTHGGIVLIGRTVTNTENATISASGGNVLIVGANTVELNEESGGPAAMIRVASDRAAAATVLNAGRIAASGGSVRLEARPGTGLAALAVNNSGVIEATGGVQQGELTLIGSGSGSVRAGGRIDVAAASISSTQGVALDGALTTQGALTVSAGQAITQDTSGHLAVGGTGGFSAGTGIALASMDNSFSGAVALSGQDVSIGSEGDLTLAGSLQVRDLSIASGGGVSFVGGVVGGALQVDSDGGIGQTGALTVQGTARLDAGNHAIALHQPGNDFGGAVTAAGSSVHLADFGDLTIAGITVQAGGALSLEAGAALTLPAAAIDTGGGALTLRAGRQLTTAAALRGGAVTLHGGEGVHLGHDVTGTTSVTLSSDFDISQAAGALTTPQLTLDADSATLTAMNAVGALGAVDLDGAFAFTNAQAIRQADGTAIAVRGTTTLDAGGHAIALTNTGNDFGDAVSASGQGISLHDAGDLVIGSLDSGVNGSLSLVAGGDLVLPAADIDTGTGALTLSSGGALTTNGRLSGGAVDLYGAAALRLEHAVSGTQSIRLRSQGAVTQTAGAVLTTPRLDLAAGSATLDTAANAVAALGMVDIGGALALRTARAIGQVAGTRMVVDGQATFDAGTHAIGFTEAGNDFKAAVHLTGGAISVRDANDLEVSGVSSVPGQSVSLVAGGELNTRAIDTGGGSLTLSALGGALSLSQAVSGGTVNLTGRDGILLGADLTATGPLTLSSSNASIIQTGGRIVAQGTTVANAGAGAVSLGSAGNDFRDQVDVTGGVVDLADANTLLLGAIDATSLDVAAGEIHLEQSIGTSGRQIYRGAVALLDDIALSSDTAGITFTSSVDGAHALDLTAATTTTFGGPVGTSTRLASLTVDAADVRVAGDILTTGGQRYDARMALDGDATLDSSGGGIAFGSTVDGGHALTVTAAGTVGFEAAVGDGTALAALDIDAATIVVNDDMRTLGDQHYRGAVALTGDVDMTSQAGGIAFGSTLDGAHALTATAAGTVSLGGAVGGGTRLSALTVDAGAFSAAAGVAVAGDLAIDIDSGDLAGSGRFFVGGGTALSTNGGRIDLAHGDNDFVGTVDIRDAGEVTIVDANALTFGEVTADALDVTSAGDLRFGTTTLAGALTAHSTDGLILHAGAARVGGATSLTARQNITFDHADNAFGDTVSLSGANVRISDRAALRFGSVDVDSLQATAPELWLAAAMNAYGYQRYTGNVRLAQDTRITSTIGDIDIDGTIDGAYALEVAAAGNVFFRDAAGGTAPLASLEVGASRFHVFGDITTVGDQVFHSAVSLGNDAAFASTDGGIAFQSTVDGASALTATAASAVTFGAAVGGAAGGRLAALTVDAGTFSAASDIAVTGGLSVTAAHGGITQAGSWRADGETRLNAQADAISLTRGDNAFAGPVHLTGGAATLRNAGALRLGEVAVSGLDVAAEGTLSFEGPAAITGTLVASADGDIEQRGGGPLSVGGAALLRANGGDITLGDIDNSFGGPVHLEGDAVALAATGDLRLGVVQADSLRATVQDGGVRFEGAAVVAQDLDVDADGVITQTASIRAGGTTTLDAGTHAIALDRSDNLFAGPAHLTGGAVSIRNADTLRLGTVAAASLQATANTIALGGDVGTRGDQTYAGAVRLDDDVVLTSTGGDIAFASTVDGAHALTATAAGALSFGGAVGALTRLTSLTADANTFSAASGIAVTRDLSIATRRGGITQAGAYAVGGAARLDANGEAITLTDDGNAFAGPVHLAGGVATLRNARALQLGEVAVTGLDVAAQGALSFGTDTDVQGALVARADGAIGQGGALRVTGTTTLDAGSHAIGLAHGGNAFGSTVHLRGGAVAIAGGGALRLGEVTAASLSATAGGTLSFAGRTDVAGRLDATAGGRIGQSAALRVGGPAMLDAGGHAIALSRADNDFTGPVRLRGGTVAIADANALRLGPVTAGALSVAAGGPLSFEGAATIAGTLDATAGGIGQSAALHVGGGTRLDAGTGAIALDRQDNAFAGPVGLQGGAVRIAAGGPLRLGTVAVAGLDASAHGGALRFEGPTDIRGDLSASTQGGAIGQTAAVRVGGRAAFDAAGGDIGLRHADNTFAGPVRLSGGAVALTASGDLEIEALGSAPDRDVALAAGGDLALTGDGIDTGEGALSLATGGTLALDGALRGGEVSLRSGTGIVFAHDVEARGGLSLDSGGDIRQTGGRLVAGRLAGRAQGAVELAGANRIGTLDAFEARSLALHNATGLQVAGPVTVREGLRLATATGDLGIDGTLAAGDVRLESAGAITQSAAGRIHAGTLSGRAAGPVRLGDADGFVDNRIGILGDFVAHGGFSLTNGQTLTLASLNGSAFTVDAGTAAFYLSVDGDLLQNGTEWLYNGTGTWAATGGIGESEAPIYVTALNSQTVEAVGRPPAYFYAVRPDGSLLPIGGGPSVNVPTSIWAARAQSANNRTVGYVDVGADASNYRAYGVVEPGIRLPEDQQPECDPDFPEPDCVAAQ